MLMNNADNSLTELSRLLERRLALVGTLATSLEASRLALIRNDAEAIARGAAHQAELCHQWSQLEDQLRFEAARRTARARSGPNAGFPNDAGFSNEERGIQLDAEWQAIGKRIRHLTRVHRSLLRHMQRSLAVVKRVVDSCAPTYTACATSGEPVLQLRAGE